VSKKKISKKDPKLCHYTMKTCEGIKEKKTTITIIRRGKKNHTFYLKQKVVRKKRKMNN